MASAPGPSASVTRRVGAWGSSLPTLLVVLVALAVLSAALAWRHRDDFAVYRAYWLSAQAPVEARFNALSATTTEAALQAHFNGLPLQCSDVPRVAGTYGDRICRAGLQRIDGVPALQLAAYFDTGRLVTVAIDLPWWAHHAALRQLVTQFGAPASIDLRPVEGSVVVWRTRSGAVDLNRDPGWDPLKPGLLQWHADAPDDLAPLTATPPATPPASEK
ncbi:MAG: hypothetical protein JWP29_5044 [Rhodoferax sp.]|nr:hypothetical protein [Rhodoferax sp.]